MSERPMYTAEFKQEAVRLSRTAIFEFVEAFYNRQRLHSTLGYESPVEHESRAYPLN